MIKSVLKYHILELAINSFFGSLPMLNWKNEQYFGKIKSGQRFSRIEDHSHDTIRTSFNCQVMGAELSERNVGTIVLHIYNGVTTYVKNSGKTINEPNVTKQTFSGFCGHLKYFL